MSFLSLILLSIALSLDCFAICLIFGAQRAALKAALKPGAEDPFPPLKWEAIKIAFIFAAFHILMICAGWFLGYSFMKYIDIFDHWIAFGLLAGIGIKMILDGYNESERRTRVHSMNQWGTLLLLGLATSIDAFAVGISLSLSSVSLLKTCICVPSVLIILTLLAIYLGSKAKMFSPKAIHLIGGLLLIGIGIRILLQHEFGL